MRSGEEKGSVHKLSGEDLPSLETMYMPHGASQLTEHLLVELLATIGHEFRTPLSVIQGSTSMLLRQRQQLPAEEQLEFLHMIQTAGERLEFLTERLLELSQLQVGAIQLEYRVVDVSSVVREAIAHVEQQVPAPLRDRVSFYLHCRDEVGNQTQEVPSVRGDVRRLREVLDQLLENAVRFYRVDTSLTREVNGLGLGLTICEYLVALHQGRIWAESCTAGGSAFHLWLPLAEPRTLN